MAAWALYALRVEGTVAALLVLGAILGWANYCHFRDEKNDSAAKIADGFGSCCILGLLVTGAAAAITVIWGAL